MASITKRNGKYFVQVRRHGHSQSRTFTQRRDAENWAKQLELDLERRDLPADPRKTLKGMTLAELIERYRDTVSVKKKAAKNEATCLNAFLRHEIAKKLVSQVTTKDFADYRDERLKTVKPTTLKRELTILQSVYNVAEKEWGLPLKLNPVEELGFSATLVKRDRILEKHELELIIQDAEKRSNKLILPVILFALATGMRQGEILKARWSDLDLKNRTLTISETKTGTPRRIPLTKKALEVLEGLDPSESKDGRIFSLKAELLKLTWKRILQRSGIVGLTFHDLRHTCITWLFDLGLHIGEVSTISGHKSWSQLKTYTNPKLSGIITKLDGQAKAA